MLANALLHVLANGGEGVVLRRPASLYEHGRSVNLIKLKVFFLLLFSCLGKQKRKEKEKKKDKEKEKEN